MCTDKWRNLLKEFKKARSHARSSGGGGSGAGGNGNAKMAYYKEIDDLLKRRGKASGGSGGGGGGSGAVKSPPSNSKIESYLQFATDNGAPLPYGRENRDFHALLDDETMTRCVLNSTSEISTCKALCLRYKPTILVYDSVHLCCCNGLLIV
jgi:hypothetical protein